MGRADRVQCKGGRIKKDDCKVEEEGVLVLTRASATLCG